MVDLREEIEESKRIVREFIGEVFYGGNNLNEKENAFKNLKFYEYFRTFNFDWLNYTGDRNEEVYSCFQKLTGMKKEVFDRIKELPNSYRGSKKDPDNMNIIRHIMITIYGDLLLKVYEQFAEINKSDLKKLQEIDIRDTTLKGKVEDTVKCYKKINNVFMIRPDTMNSLSGKFDSKYQDVYGVAYIDLFKENGTSKSPLELSERDFYNKYHTLGNFVLMPNEETKRILSEEVYGKFVAEWKKGNKRSTNFTINTYRGLCLSGNFGKDDFSAYLGLLEIELKSFKENSNEENIFTNLLYNNRFFYNCFESFEECCEKLFLEKDLYKLRDESYEYIKSIIGDDNKDVQKSYYILSSNIIIEARCTKLIAELYKELNK